MSSPGVVKGYAEGYRRPREVTYNVLLHKMMQFLCALPKEVSFFILSAFFGLKDFFRRATIGFEAPKAIDIDDDGVQAGVLGSVKSISLLMDKEEVSQEAGNFKTRKKKQRKKAKNSTSKTKSTDRADFDIQNVDLNICCDVSEVGSNGGTVSSDGDIEVKFRDKVDHSQTTTTEDTAVVESMAVVEDNDKWVEIKSKAAKRQAKKQSRNNIPLLESNVSSPDIARTPRIAASLKIKSPEAKVWEAAIANTVSRANKLSSEPTSTAPKPNTRTVQGPQSDVLSDQDAFEETLSTDGSEKEEQAEYLQPESAAHIHSEDKPVEEEEVEWTFSSDDEYEPVTYNPIQRKSLVGQAVDDGFFNNEPLQNESIEDEYSADDESREGTCSEKDAPQNEANQNEPASEEHVEVHGTIPEEPAEKGYEEEECSNDDLSENETTHTELGTDQPSGHETPSEELTEGAKKAEPSESEPLHYDPVTEEHAQNGEFFAENHGEEVVAEIKLLADQQVGSECAEEKCEVEACKDYSMQANDEEGQAETVEGQKQDEDTESSHFPEEDEGLPASRAEDEVIMSPGSCEQEFIGTEDHQKTKDEENTRISTKSGECSEEAPNLTVEEEWTEVSSAKKRKQKQTSPASITTTPTKASSANTKEEKTSSPRRGSKKSTRRLPCQSISTPPETPSKLTIATQSYPVKALWDITKTSSWGTESATTASHEAQKDISEPPTESFMSPLLSQKEFSTVPTDSAPPTDSETETQIFSPRLEQTASSVASDPDATTSEYEDQEMAIVLANSKEETQEAPAEKEAVIPPATPKNKRMSTCAPNTLQRETRTIAVGVLDCFGQGLAIGSQFQTSSLSKTETLPIAAYLVDTGDVDSPGESIYVSNEMGEQDRETPSPEGDDVTQDQTEGSPSLVAPEKANEVELIPSKEQARPEQEQIELQSASTKVEGQDAGNSSGISTTKVEKAKETLSSVADVNDSAKTLKPVEMMSQDRVETQASKAFETTRHPKNEYSARIWSNWRLPKENTPPPISTPSSRSTSTDRREGMVVLGRRKQVETKGKEVGGPAETPAAALCPLAPTVSVVAPKKLPWTPKDGTFWADLDDE